MCIVGVSSLRKVVARGQNYVNKKFIRQQLGTRKKDLESRSPLTLVDRITSPLLLVHGAKDRIVDVKQSRLIAKALEKSGKNYRYVEFETGTHHLTIQRYRHEFSVCLMSSWPKIWVKIALFERLLCYCLVGNVD